MNIIEMLKVSDDAAFESTSTQDQWSSDALDKLLGLDDL